MGSYIALSVNKVYTLKITHEVGKEGKYQNNERRWENQEHLSCRYKRLGRYLGLRGI